MRLSKLDSILQKKNETKTKKKSKRRGRSHFLVVHTKTPVIRVTGLLFIAILLIICDLLFSAVAGGSSPRVSQPPSPPSSYDQDIMDLRGTNARLQEEIDNLKVSEDFILL